MYRNGDLIKSNQFIKYLQAINSINLKTQNYIMSKKEMWELFKDTFHIIHGKELLITEEVISNLKTLFYYYLKDDKFFNCQNLIKDISKPSFDKGLLIVGGYGIGKTDYFKVFEKIFYKYDEYRFKFYTSKELVLNFELCQTPNDKEYFFKDCERKQMFIDDLTSEREASNYGKVDVIEEILALRYEKRLKTFLSCNYFSDNYCVVETLDQLGERYGARIYDRLFESFNVVEFKGKSFRK